MTERVLLTGFERFGPHGSNPSEALVRRFADAPPPGVVLHTLVLPVAYGRAFGPVHEALDAGVADAVLHLGLAAGRDAPEFERFALNWRGGAAPDETGVVLEGEPIDPAGPAAYLSTLPVADLAAACAAAGVPARASSHAGTFLCNQVLYQTLRYVDLRGLPVRAGFLHLPEPAEDGAAGKPTLDLLARAVAATLRRVAELPRMPPPPRLAPRTRGGPGRFVRPTGRM